VNNFIFIVIARHEAICCDYCYY